MVKETKIASMIYIPENFSYSIINNSDVNITIYKSSSNNSFYIEEVVKKITNQIDISSLTGHFVLKNIEKSIILNDLDKKKHFENSFNEALKELTSNNKVSVEYEILSVQKENLILPTGFNATSPGFGVMFVMMGAFFTAVVLAEEREMNILSRLLTTPITKIVVLSGNYWEFFV